MYNYIIMHSVKSIKTLQWLY